MLGSLHERLLLPLTMQSPYAFPYRRSIPGMMLERGCYLVSYVWTSYSIGEAQWSMDGCAGLAQCLHIGTNLCLTVRSVQVTEAWQESGQDFVTVHILAFPMDYTIDES